MRIKILNGSELILFIIIIINFFYGCEKLSIDVKNNTNIVDPPVEEVINNCDNNVISTKVETVSCAPYVGNSDVSNVSKIIISPEVLTSTYVSNGNNVLKMGVNFYNSKGSKLSSCFLYSIFKDDVKILNPYKSCNVSGDAKFKATVGNITSNELTIKIKKDIVYTYKTYQLIFNIFHDGSAIGVGNNVSEESIDAQVQLLNDFYSNKVGTTSFSSDPNSAKVYFKFEKSKVNRIVATNKNGTFTIETSQDEAKRSFGDLKKYINIFVMPLEDGLAGFSDLPFNFDDNGLKGLTLVDRATYDNDKLSYNSISGIWLDNKEIMENQYSICHEMGHKFGLLHPFFEISRGESCSNGKENDKTTDADFCDDTPPYESNSGLEYKYSRNTCDGKVYLANNIMDYDFKSSINVVTYDQRVRLRFCANDAPIIKYLSKEYQTADFINNSNLKALIKPKEIETLSDLTLGNIPKNNLIQCKRRKR